MFLQEGIMKIFKKFFVTLCVFGFVANFVGCSGLADRNERVDAKSVNESRKAELVQLALTGDYVSSVEEMESGILSLLYENSDNSRSAVSASNYALKLVNKMEVKTEPSVPSARSVQVTEYGTSEFFLYDIENKAAGSRGYAIASTDRRLGSILTIVDDGEFEEDISEDPFMQVFAENLEDYIQETTDIWETINDDDLEEFAARTATSAVVKSGNYRYTNWKWNSGNEKSLLKTKWNQGSPYSPDAYNKAIASIYGTNYYTGCVTTAVAQIMAFHEYPKTCRKATYSTLKSKWSDASNWNGTYEWSKMKANAYANNLSKIGKVEVGALMYDIAEGIKAEYKTDGTSAKMSNIMPYLKTLNYRSGSLQSYNFASIKKSIDNGNPVIISGNSQKTTTKKKFLWWNITNTTYKNGHAWVVDGYANLTCKATSKTDSKDVKTITGDYIHCNLGWGGSCNGYYLSGVFDTRTGATASDYDISRATTTTSGEDYNYQYNMKIIPNIHHK